MSHPQHHGIIEALKPGLILHGLLATLELDYSSLLDMELNRLLKHSQERWHQRAIKDDYAIDRFKHRRPTDLASHHVRPGCIRIAGLTGDRSFRIIIKLYILAGGCRQTNMFRLLGHVSDPSLKFLEDWVINPTDAAHHHISAHADEAEIPEPLVLFHCNIEWR